MKISTYMKNFIQRKETKDLINSNSFETLYHSCYIWNRTDLTKLLAEAGINPLPYLCSIPMYFCDKNLDISALKVPKQVMYIQERAFFGCKNLVTLDFEDDSKLESIYIYAFSGTGLSRITLPKSVIALADYSFSDCNNLEYVDIKSDHLALCDHAFSDNNKLKEIKLPHLTILYPNVFSGSKIEKIYFKDSFDDVIKAIHNHTEIDIKTTNDLLRYLDIKIDAKAYFGV